MLDLSNPVLVAGVATLIALSIYALGVWTGYTARGDRDRLPAPRPAPVAPARHRHKHHTDTRAWRIRG